MSRKPSFANLRGAAPVATAGSAPAAASGAGQSAIAGRPLSREGRKQIAGFFRPRCRWRCTCSRAARAAVYKR